MNLQTFVSLFKKETQEAMERGDYYVTIKLTGVQAEQVIRDLDGRLNPSYGAVVGQRAESRLAAKA